MKTKLIIASAAILILSITFFSFKSGEKESCGTAIVSSVISKEKDSEGFLIQYGDGSVELKRYEFTRNFVEPLSIIAQLMNELHAKGYRYVGTGTHTQSFGVQLSYMVFEKK